MLVIFSVISSRTARLRPSAAPFVSSDRPRQHLHGADSVLLAKYARDNLLHVPWIVVALKALERRIGAHRLGDWRALGELLVESLPT
jgi:hypothetical protein